MPQSHPRVLFLTSAAFNRITGGGITFSNLFAGWPKNALATVHNDSVPVTYETCNLYYRLSEREIHRWGWLRHIPLGKPPLNIEPVALAVPKRDWKWNLLKRAKTWIFGDAIPEVGELSPELEAWVVEFQPTVIYTILGSNAMMELAEQLRTRFRLPLVVHVMDDWASVVYRGGLLSFLQRSKKDRLMQHLMNVSAYRLAICDAMAIAYQKRYGQPFMAFQNTIDVAAWSRFTKNPETIGIPVRVAYIGSIFPFAQLESLIDCCKAIQQLHDSGFAIRMEIYSPTYLAAQYREHLVVGNAVELHDTIRDDETFFATLQAVDILVLPVNFDAYTQTYIRYSMPTKVPAYLTIGTPILAYGPPDTAQIDYAKSSGWALTVTEHDSQKLQQALHLLATDIPLRSRLNRTARQLASEHHDTQTVRSQFQACLAKAALHSAT